jgi:hypothetical protein
VSFIQRYWWALLVVLGIAVMMWRRLGTQKRG